MSAPAACAFPLFRERFLLQPLSGGGGNAPELGLGGACGGPPAPGDPALSPTKAASRMGNLRVLDLRALPRDDGPPTELRARKEKLAHFERQCSRVAEGLYVGAEWVAKSREALAAAGITHVVNCVGFLYPPYFEAELAYQTLYLQGAAAGGVAVGCCTAAPRRAGRCRQRGAAVSAARRGERRPRAAHAFRRAAAAPAACRHAWRGHPVRALRRV